MAFFPILGLDYPDSNITADHITITFTGTRLYQRPQTIERACISKIV